MIYRLIQLLLSFFRFEHLNSLFECIFFSFGFLNPIYPFNALYFNWYVILIESNIFAKSSLTFIKLHFDMPLLRFNVSICSCNLFISTTILLSLKYVDVYSLNCLVSLQISYICVFLLVLIPSV